MAEPILGQALALQSEFRPDTTQVLTKAVNKLGDVTLKKQIAATKAAEAKAKREQDTMAAIKLKSGKLGVHYVGDAQQLLTQGIGEITEATQKGDLAKKVLLEGQYQTALDNLVFENDRMDNFRKTKQQGGLIPAPVELGLDMPRAQANEYFKKLLVENPEYRLIFDQTPEGYYTYNPVKKIDEASEYGKLISENSDQYKVKTVTRQDGKDIVSFSIADTRINDLANLLASDDTYRANALINNKVAVNNEVQAALKANPALKQEEAQEIGLKSYFLKNLQSANQKYSVSNTPQDSSPSGDRKVKIIAKDFSPTTLKPEQIKAIVDLKDETSGSTMPNLGGTTPPPAVSMRTGYSSVNMPNISDVFSFTDDQGREFAAPVNNLTDYNDKLYLTGTAKNIAAEGVNISMKYGMPSATELTPSAWKALVVYYAKQGIDGQALAKYMNNNLAEAGSKLRIDPNTGKVSTKVTTQPRTTNTPRTGGAPRPN
jgi:hypothetical protein